MAEKKKTEADQEMKYTAEQIVKSARYASDQDLISAIFDNGKKYTLAEVDTAVAKFKEGKVK